MFKKSFFRLIVINTYILLVIILMLYIYPGLINYNENNTKKAKKITKEEYISGDYLNDKNLFNIDNMYFPIALSSSINESVNYIDSYGFRRTYNGERSHEGCDIMTNSGKRGEYPIVAVCDGIIEQLGWLELGGYRIGIKSESGVYYYYAHLYRYEDGLNVGSKVIAGQVIGYIGDTGYSKVEGTTGNFDVHLHFGIYLHDDANKEYTVNPYPLLKKLENSIIKYGYENKR